MERLNQNPEIQQEIIRALSPQEIMELKKVTIPPEVLSTVNQMLAENISGSGFATLYEKDIVKTLVKAGLKRSEIIEKHWLDFESMYEDAGWEVTYDRPAYNEDY